MTIITVPTRTKRGFNSPNPSETRMQVTVHIDTEVLNPEVARRRANVWLLETVGNLLGAENAELILSEPLRWRFDVILGLPDLDHPGSGDLLGVSQSQAPLNRLLGLTPAGVPSSRIQRLSGLGADVVYSSGNAATLKKAIDRGIPPSIFVGTGELP